MIKLWKTNGRIDRRDFLKGCGQAMVVTASYQAVSVVLGEKHAAAAPADVHVPDAPLDAALSAADKVVFAEEAAVFSKSRQENMNVIDYIKHKVKDKLEPRQPSAICGVRG